eukprot:5020587-Amphidinium_carterae.2
MGAAMRRDIILTLKAAFKEVSGLVTFCALSRKLRVPYIFVWERSLPSLEGTGSRYTSTQVGIYIFHWST